MTGGRELVQQLHGDEVHLAEVGLAGVAAYAGTVLDGDAGVGVALHAPALPQHHDVRGRLREAVCGIDRDGDDDTRRPVRRWRAHA